MIILVGIDDTDSLDSRGTNKLARAIAEQLAPRFACRLIVRHQLLFDERIPFTSHNGSAGLWLEPIIAEPTAGDLTSLAEEIRAAMLSDFIPGSDPGLCLATCAGEAFSGGERSAARRSNLTELYEWGRRCQCEIVTQAEARALAERAGVHLEGLGGTNGGIIGALAAVGLTHTGNDGRLVHWQTYPDDLSGSTAIAELRRRQIEVRVVADNPLGSLTDDGRSTHRFQRSDGTALFDGVVDVGKHLRPNLREYRAVLFVTKASNPAAHNAEWTALKLK